jgi:hypothetical protein
MEVKLNKNELKLIDSGLIAYSQAIYTLKWANYSDKKFGKKLNGIDDRISNLRLKLHDQSVVKSK